ncbi:hypothetical protein YC2023_081051 [Brassica napus]
MIVAGFFESKKNHGNELIEKLEAGMQDMLQIAEDRKRDVVAPKLKENLQYVGGIEEDMVEGFLYEVPEEYINMPFLKRSGFENDSESSQVFWLLTERELTPSNSNILDGRYDVFGGYVTHNEDFLADLKVDNVTEVIQVVSG